MKSRIASVILSQPFQLSWMGSALRAFVRATHGAMNYSPHFRLDTQALDRPNYAYCMLGGSATTGSRPSSSASPAATGSPSCAPSRPR
jgi:hypothetical protein